MGLAFSSGFDAPQPRDSSSPYTAYHSQLMPAFSKAPAVKEGLGVSIEQQEGDETTLQIRVLACTSLIYLRPRLCAFPP